MIEHLPPQEQVWLARFFASPNELSWTSLLDGSAPPHKADQVRQWLGLLGSHAAAPLILPFMRSGAVTGWCAKTQGASGGYELGDEINAWLGSTWLSRFERVPEDSNDPMATALRGHRLSFHWRRCHGDADDLGAAERIRWGSGSQTGRNAGQVFALSGRSAATSSGRCLPETKPRLRRRSASSNRPAASMRRISATSKFV